VTRCWRGYLSGARCKQFASGPADATATPSSLALLKSTFGLTFLVLAYPGCSAKEAVKWQFVFLFIMPKQHKISFLYLSLDSWGKGDVNTEFSPNLDIGFENPV